MSLMTGDGKKKKSLSDFLYHKAAKLKIPLSGTFELSPICNFTCKMCYVRKTKMEVEGHPRKALGLEEWRQLAKQAKDEGLLYLLVTGGEPLLWPYFWELYEELSEMGFLISINTNGSLIDEHVIERFRERPPHKICITLYGISDETYKRLCGIDAVFSKVDNAVSKLLENGIAVKLNCSLTPENVCDLEDIVNYAKSHNVVLTVATYMFPPVRRDPEEIGKNARFTPEEEAKNRLKSYLAWHGQEKYEQLLDYILDGSVIPLGIGDECVDPVDGQVRCRAGKASFWITWDGWMTACGMLPEPKVDMSLYDFHTGWGMLVEETEKLKLSGLCERCNNKELCHPCAAIAYAETGTASGLPVYLCESVDYLQKYARKGKEEAF